MVTINVGLSGWIIGDRNYPGFRVGEEARFALNFYSKEGLTHVAHSEKSLSPLHEIKPLYEVKGRVMYASPKTWVCDFGLLAYRREAATPEWARVGATVAGSAYLSVDPFDYFETLYKLPDMPELTYRVTIRRIYRDTTPWIMTSSDRPIRKRDQTRVSYEEIEYTGSIGDHRRSGGQNQDFVLECEALESGVERWRRFG